jgi:hypothetical protein
MHVGDRLHRRQRQRQTQQQQAQQDSLAPSSSGHVVSVAEIH